MFYSNCLINYPKLSVNSITYMSYNTTMIAPLERIPGLGLGIPLNIFQLGFTSLYYNENIITPDLVFLQFMIGVFTYGSDRFFDSKIINSNNIDIINSLETKKLNYYNYLQDNQYFVIMCLSISYIYVYGILFNDILTLPIIPLLTSTIEYKKIKTIIGPYKPVYVSTLWMTGSLILPSILHSHDYGILEDYKVCLSFFSFMFALTNFQDIKDIEEDRLANITTIPVLYGEKTAVSISCGSILVFLLLLCDLL